MVTTLNELDAVLEKVTADEMATYGLVLEENLRQVRTLSVREIAVGSIRISYHGTQRTVRDNEGRPVYGGSDLVCVRGGWEALDALPMSPEGSCGGGCSKTIRRGDGGVPRLYGVAHGTMMSVRVSARTVGPQSGVLEPSWRMGGASSADSWHWQRSRATRPCRSLAHPMSRNTAKAAKLPQVRSSTFRGMIPRRAPCCDTPS